MGVRFRRGRARSIVGLPATILLLGSAFVASAAGGQAGPRPTGGLWGSSVPTRSLTTTVYVSAVSCRHVGSGQYSGQRSGAEVFGSSTSHGIAGDPFDFAGYYSYCHGQRAFYRAEFLVSVPATGLLEFRPTSLRIAPGDPLEISLINHGAHLTLTIRDVNTRRTATTSGPALGRGTGWAAGVLPLFGGALGEPYLRGSLPLVEEYNPTGGPSTISGPTPFAPVVFRGFHINSATLGNGKLSPEHGNIRASRWYGTSGHGVAVTRPHNGAFVATGRLKAPELGKTVDATPVSGTTLIEIPGTHHFLKLGKGATIPNGSQIDASHGQVQLTLGLPHGKAETGVFYDGRFRLHQNGSTGATTATLTGANPLAVCSITGNGGAVSVASTTRASTTRASTARAFAHKGKHGNPKGKGSTGPAGGGGGKPKGKKLSSLWANAHGNFTTDGSGGAAAVLGTRWFTEDTCDGTYFKVVRDKIRVTVYYPYVHTVVVTQGHSFFAPNEIPVIDVSPVTSTGGRYNVQISGSYELTVVSSRQPAYVDAAVAPQEPSGGNVPLYPDGTVNGTARWHIIFHITPNLINFQDWNVGVRVGGVLYVVALRVN